MQIVEREERIHSRNHHDTLSIMLLLLVGHAFSSLEWWEEFEELKEILEFGKMYLKSLI